MILRHEKRFSDVSIRFTEKRVSKWRRTLLRIVTNKRKTDFGMVFATRTHTEPELVGKSACSLAFPMFFPIAKTEIFLFNHYNMLGQKDGFSRKKFMKIYSIISST